MAALPPQTISRQILMWPAERLPFQRRWLLHAGAFTDPSLTTESPSSAQTYRRTRRNELPSSARKRFKNARRRKRTVKTWLVSGSSRKTLFM